MKPTTSGSWAARLGALKSRQVPDTDERVIEARRELAVRRVQRAVDAERDVLDADAIRRALLDTEEVPA